MAPLGPTGLAQPVPLPWGEVMPLGAFPRRMEILVHMWDLAQATGQTAGLEPGLVDDALEPPRQLTPAGRSAGLVGPECAVAEDAGDLARFRVLLAIAAE